MRVLVCGGRDFQDQAAVWRALNEVAEISANSPLGNDITVVHGACPTGADMLADLWAVRHWMATERYPADWKAHGRAAGPIRNAQMIREGKPDLVLAFAGGRGTADMVRQARAVGIPVREIAEYGDER